ncbi:hypothetical protein PG991_003923 [Apiospora marii]|uniref:RNase MRP protein 1 RNA binding domain-containing protein n=2 Tax=Apiospora marii TaxID=335849 RepID=A0ABR1S4T8_9PEZI
MKAQPTIPPDSSNNLYHETLQLVRPLQPLLAGFNHRNKNQHRVATWWASFNMLRRHVTKWADELDQQAQARPKKRKRTAAGDGSEKKDEGGPAEVRGLWLRDVLVPKCYLTFSQLAADNQFAPLGLVLTGALAQAYKACVRLVGEAPSEREEMATRLSKPAVAISDEAAGSPAAATAEKGMKATSKDTSSSSSSAAKRQVSAIIGDDDVGQVISRDSVRAAAAAPKTGRDPLAEEEEAKAQKAKRRKRAVAGVVDPTTEEDVRHERKKKKKAQFDDGTAAAVAGDGDDGEKKKKKGAAVTGRPKARDGEKPPEEKKKKKKSKKGDEFDSLFSSLF